jgi:hypothetical protein
MFGSHFENRRTGMWKPVSDKTCFTGFGTAMLEDRNIM